MRFKKLFIWDMRFQARYGFYLLYTFLTIFYVVVLFSLPQAAKDKAAALLIFSDPAAMGLFFMGAIVLLEKSQRVTAFLAITPLKAMEYVVSKVLSLNIIAMVVAAALTLASGSAQLPGVLAGTFLAGTIFTLLGIIVATKITSLNQFILYTVPFEIIGFVPAILHLFGVTPKPFSIYPANACMDLISGKRASGIGTILAILTSFLLLHIAAKCVQKMWQEQGGVKI